MSSAASLTFPVLSFQLFRTLVASAPLSIRSSDSAISLAPFTQAYGWAVQFHPQRARLLPELCRPRGPRLHELDIVSAGPAHELHRHADLFRPLVEMRELPYEQIQERVQILHRSLNLVRTKPHPREHLSLLRRGGLRRENGALKSHHPVVTCSKLTPVSCAARCIAERSA